MNLLCLSRTNLGGTGSKRKESSTRWRTFARCMMVWILWSQFGFESGAEAFPMVFPFTQSWHYDQSGTDLGNGWRESDFDDSDWASGVGMFFYPEISGFLAPINTILSLTNAAGSNIVTYYFRTRFTYTNALIGLPLVASNLVDDGAVFYLNGVEVQRVGMPSGTISNATLATRLSSGFDVLFIGKSNLVQGENLLAVEVHQRTAGISSDAYFGMSLSEAIPPVIVTQPGDRTVFTGQRAAFGVELGGSPPFLFQWLHDNVPVPGATNQVYSITNVCSGDSGQYSVLVSNIAGSTGSTIATLVALTSIHPLPGSLDTNFSPTFPHDIVESILLQPDQKILAGGNFYPSADGYIAVTRLNPDGSVDTGFSSALREGARVLALALQPDRKILMGGNFAQAYGMVGTNLIRYQPDGAFDPVFRANMAITNTVRSVAVQADGKIVVGGDFLSFSGTTRNRIARFNQDGSLDLSFDPKGGADGDIKVIAFEDTGRILVGGAFTTFNGIPKPHLARLKLDGSLDLDYPAGTGPGGIVNSILPRRDGWAYIGGVFWSVNGVPAVSIAHLDRDGSVDPRFSAFRNITRLGGGVYAMVVQRNGRIVAGGSYSAQPPAEFHNIFRLNADGSLDFTFDSGTGPDSLVETLALQEDGKILAGGYFYAYNGFAAHYIVRINSDPPEPTLECNRTVNNQMLLSWPAWGSSFALQTRNDLQAGSWTAVTNTPVLTSNRLSVLHTLTSSNQFFKLVGP